MSGKPEEREVGHGVASASERLEHRHEEDQVGKSQHLEGATLDGEALAWDKGLCRCG